MFVIAVSSGLITPNTMSLEIPVEGLRTLGAEQFWSLHSQVCGKSMRIAQGKWFAFLLLLIAGLLCAKGGEARPENSEILSVDEFNKIRFEVRGVSIVAPISPDVPEHVFRLIPDSHEDDPNGLRQHVGRIEISKGRSGQVFQTIEVFAQAPIEFFVRLFEFIDINNDGYLDIRTYAEFGGAKWGRWQYWVYDPKSGRFVSNWLTKRLSTFRCSEIYPDEQNIYVRHLTTDGISEEGYELKGRRLVLVSKEETKPGENGFIITSKKRIDGKWQVVSVGQKAYTAD